MVAGNIVCVPSSSVDPSASPKDQDRGSAPDHHNSVWFPEVVCLIIANPWSLPMVENQGTSDAGAALNGLAPERHHLEEDGLSKSYLFIYIFFYIFN